MATTHTSLPRHKELVYPETMLYPGSLGFPNSENPTLQSNMTWNSKYKRVHCVKV